LFNSVRLSRVKNEMSLAAKKKEVYHLWWHPHNFGTDPEGALSELKAILIHFRQLNEKWGMQSLNMGQIGEMMR